MTDVVVVGSGAGGGPLALRLSQAGLRVLVLEKGPRHRRTDYRHDELQALAEGDPFVPSLRDDPHVLVDHDAADPAPRRSKLGWIASCVGGGTAHMGGTFLRLHPDDFRLRSRMGPFEAVADWPYGYDELEPYYSLAEREIGVSGGRGTNPFEGHRSHPYPLPPLDTHPLGRSLDAACERLGLHPFSTPRAINSRPYGGRPACAYCTLCSGFGCPTGARGSTAEALIPRAEATGRCTVVSRAMVREITLGPSGRATGCVYIDRNGVERRVRARVVCVCCSAVESARLLLLSRSAAFPDGLANGSGAVGRNLQFHVRSAGTGAFLRDRHPDRGLDDRNAFLLRALMDFYFLPPEVTAWPKGGVHRFDMERTHPIAAAQRLALRGGPEVVWGAALQRRLREHFHERRTVAFEVFQDFVPSAGTWMELDPSVVDRWGLPVARIHLSVSPHHREAGAWLVARGLEVLAEMGADEVRAGGIGYTSNVMAHGTCRAGDDPSSSVVDRYCRTHEVPNLFVADGSFMPTSGGAPSTLSIVANGFRTADYIADRARSLELGT